MSEVEPSVFAIQELGLPTYNDLHRRVAELEDALRLAINRLDALAWAGPARVAEAGIDIKSASKELREILENTAK